MGKASKHIVNANGLQAAAESRLTETLSKLRQMVGINSFTLNKPGVKELAEFQEAWFGELGFKAEYVTAKNPDHAAHLVLTRQGKSGRVIGMISHLDTVFPAEEEQRNDFSWREEGGRIHGPGTIDIKGGTALMHMTLATLRRCSPAAFDDATWVLLFNSAEEVSSPDFGDLCRARLPAESLAALVFEGGGKAGNEHALVSARKGRVVFQVEARGRGAHAGNNHAQGANAIVQLAHTIQKIEALTDYPKGVTFNVGVVSGGSGINRVAEHASAQVEMRAFDEGVFRGGIKALNALCRDIEVISADDASPCKVKATVVSDIKPWPRNLATEGLVSVWHEAARSIGSRLVTQERGGVSDANHIWDSVPTLDGLGPCGDQAHCSERGQDGVNGQEYVERDSFVPKTVLNVAGIQRLLRS